MKQTFGYWNYITLQARVCSHCQRPRPIKNRLYGIVWRCSYCTETETETDTVTDVNGFQTHLIGLVLCQCEHALM